MLIYHPAFDAYHCTFRLLALTKKCPVMEVDKARILDFYLAFPNVVAEMRLPQDRSAIRTLAKSLINPYRNPVNAKRTFTDMQQVQIAALSALAASGFLDSDALAEGTVRRTTKEMPNDLEEMIAAFLTRDRGMAAALIEGLCNLPTFGVSGLKDRSGLLEYRYDVV
jgi:ABC-3C biological conflict system middle component